MSAPKKKPTPKKKKQDDRPRILVVEGLSGASRCVELSGGKAITVNPRDLWVMDEALLDGFHGLLLTGGGDVDPRLYGEKPHKDVYGVSEVRDYAEWMALDRARELDVPVLGICRGSQLMAVHNGGRLKQHVEGHRGMDHLVFGEPGSLFRRVIRHERGFFRSLHHQVVLRTGAGWRVAARASRGTIEAIESRDGRCLGVQFHPEMDYGTNLESRLIFEWLATESAKRAGLPKPTPRRLRTPAPAKRPARSGKTLTQLRFPDSTAAPTRVPQRRSSTMTTTWLCSKCGIRFDEKKDRDDHVYWLHGDGLPTMRTIEPTRTIEPPDGHPDWD